MLMKSCSSIIVILSIIVAMVVDLTFQMPLQTPTFNSILTTTSFKSSQVQAGAGCTASSKFFMTDYLGLYSFYNSTGGKNWAWKNSTFGSVWEFYSVSPTSTYAPLNPCYEEWQGLTCNSACSRITSLSLIDYGLVGELLDNAGVCNFPVLETLDLSLNRNLSGTLPSCLGSSAPFLKFLSMEVCNLEGTIPTSYSGLTKLEVITFTNNSLSGELPAFIPRNFSHIRGIFLQGNLFSGTVWHDMDKMVYLEYLVLSENLIHGSLPHALTELRNLSMLAIASAELSGSFPHGFHNVSSLTVINIYQNQMYGYIKETWLHSFKNMIEFNIGNNMYTGDIPSNISLWQQLNYLNLYSNLFSSSIPETLGDIPYLLEFDVKGNSLSGSIPKSVGNLQYLQTFDVGSNFLNGTLPEELGNCTNLNTFLVNNNFLNGTIPVAYANLTELNGFVLSSNFLSGSIPAFIGNMQKLLHLEMDFNKFHGEIPINVTHLPFLNTLYLDNNMLTGRFPTYSKNSSQFLNSIDVGENFLSGSIQSDIFECLPSLIMFSVESNKLTGPFPSLSYLNPDNSNGSAPSASKLTEIYMNDNAFNSSLPNDVGFLKAIHNFDIHHNQFTGTIPSSLWTYCNHLNYLYLYSNKFHGQLHVDMSFLSELVELRLDVNHLSGTFPLTDDNKWQGIVSINISYNSISGSIPAGVQQLTLVQSLDLSNNKFSGEISDKFANLKYLQQLFLQSNHLEGEMNELINVDIQRTLYTIDVSDNSIHGSLPESIFYLPNITIFSASKNCLTGSLPDNICNATSLSILALDGLHTADACQDRIFPGSSFITAYMLKNPLRGQIPSCLFNSMPRLQTLHLSGNGIDGDLGGILGNYSTSTGQNGLMESLTDLSLSYNRLSSTIPNVLLSLPDSGKVWSNLDLSFNKFTGTLYEDMWNFSGSSLKLDINRISGKIPKALRHTENINILDGNIFSCSQSRSSLPEHDPEVESYVCGSDAADRSIYTWIIFATLTVVAVLGMIFIASTSGRDISAVNAGREAAMSSPKLVSGKERANADISSSTSTMKQKLIYFIHGGKTFWQLTVPQANSHTESIDPKSGENIKKENYIVENSGDNQISTDVRNASDQIRIFGNTMLHIRFWCRRIAIFILATVIPIASILSLYYSRYTHSYAWFISIAFLSGIPPAVTLLVYFMVYLALLYSRSLCGRVTLNIAYLEKQFYSVDVSHNEEISHDENDDRVGEEIEEDNWHHRSNKESLRDGGVNNKGQFGIHTDELSNERTSRNSADRQQSVTSVQHEIKGSIDKENVKKLQKLHKERRRKLYLVLFAIFLFNIIIVLAINMIYVYFLTTNLSTQQKQLLSFVLAVYKFLWNTAVMEFFQDFAIGFLFLSTRSKTNSSPNQTNNGKGDGDATMDYLKQLDEDDEEVIQGVMITFFMLLSLFNNILAPIISVAIISSDCFYYAVVQNPPEVTSSYSVTTCNDKHFSLSAFGEVCTVKSTTVYSTSYNPPFVYSYQCTSELLVNFVDIFIYRYLLGGVAAPAVEILLKLTQEYLFRSFGEFDWRVVLCTSLLQPMLRPVSSHDNSTSNQENINAADEASTRGSTLSRNSVQQSRFSSSSTRSHSNTSRDLIALRVTSIFQPMETSRGQSSNQNERSSTLSERDSAQPEQGLDHPLSRFNLNNHSKRPNRPDLFTAVYAAREQRKLKEKGNENLISDKMEVPPDSTSQPSVGEIGKSEDKTLVDVEIGNSSIAESLNNKIEPVLDEASIAWGSFQAPAETKRFPLFKAKNFIIILVSDIGIMLVFGTVFPPIAVVGCVTVVLRTIFIQVILGRFIHLTQQQSYLLPYLQQINKECLGIRSLMLQTFQTLSDLLSLIWACFLFDILGDKMGFMSSIWIFVLMALWSFIMRVIDWSISYLQVNCCMPYIGEGFDETDEEGNIIHKTSWWKRIFICCRRQRGKKLKTAPLSFEMTESVKRRDNLDSYQITNKSGEKVDIVLNPLSVGM